MRAIKCTFSNPMVDAKVISFFIMYKSLFLFPYFFHRVFIQWFTNGIVVDIGMARNGHKYNLPSMGVRHMSDRIWGAGLFLRQ